MERLRYLFVPDIHCPAQDWAKVKAVVARAKADKPERIILLGDVLDAWLLSRFTKKERQMMTSATAKREKKDTLTCLKMFADLATDHITEWIPGNHEERAYQRLSEIPWLAEYADVPYEKMAEETGVRFVHSGAVLLPGSPRIYVHHGHQTQANVEGAAIVHGHDHHLTLKWRSQRLWTMSCGYLAKSLHPCFKYRGAASKFGFSSWKNGYAGVDWEGWPWAIPL